jgi:hypothetical protein
MLPAGSMIFAVVMQAVMLPVCGATVAVVRQACNITCNVMQAAVLAGMCLPVCVFLQAVTLPACDTSFNPVL